MRRNLTSVVFALLLSTLSVTSLAAETYVVPIWASGLSGSDGEWWAQAVIINPHPFPVTYRVARVFPLATSPCPECAGGDAPVSTLPPRGFRIVEPQVALAGARLIAGALEVQTSHPVKIHLVAYRPGEHEIRQRLDVARGRLSPGVHSISSVEFAPADVRMNVFVINPSETPIEVAVWAQNRAENEIRVSVPPASMRAVRLPTPLCGGQRCSYPDIFPPYPFQVDMESNGDFLAFVSSVGKHWAVFSLPDEIGAH